MLIGRRSGLIVRTWLISPRPRRSVRTKQRRLLSQRRWFMPSQQEGDARPDAGQATYTYTETRAHLHVNAILFCERGSCCVEAVSRWLPELRAISQAAGRPSVSLIQPFTPRNIKPVNGEMFSSFWRFGERDGPHRCPRWTPTPPKVAMGGNQYVKLMVPWQSVCNSSPSTLYDSSYLFNSIPLSGRSRQLGYIGLFHSDGAARDWTPC